MTHPNAPAAPIIPTTHPNAPYSFWTEPKSDALRSLWDAGRLSARAIGKELGCSRNAILAKVHRLKLTRRVSTREIAERSKRSSRSKAAKATRAKIRAERTAAQATQVAKPVIPPKPKPAEMTKPELRAMLAQAVRNTAALQPALDEVSA